MEQFKTTDDLRDYIKSLGAPRARPAIEEKETIHHYAKALNNISIESILQNDGIKTSEEAKELARFFWQMMDQTVNDSEKI